VANPRAPCKEQVKYRSIGVAPVWLLGWLCPGAFDTEAPKERHLRFLSLGTFSSLSNPGPYRNLVLRLSAIGACKEQVEYRSGGRLWFLLLAAAPGRHSHSPLLFPASNVLLGRYPTTADALPALQTEDACSEVSHGAPLGWLHFAAP
jgi:hypothetical protein